MKDSGKEKPSITASWDVSSCSYYENKCGGLQRDRPKRPYDLAISLLHSNLKVSQSAHDRDTGTVMLMVILVTAHEMEAA